MVFAIGAKFWLEKQNCTSKTSTVDGTNIELIQGTCPNGSEAAIYALPDMGHAWPGSDGTETRMLGYAGFAAESHRDDLAILQGPSEEIVSAPNAEFMALAFLGGLTHPFAMLQAGLQLRLGYGHPDASDVAADFSQRFGVVLFHMAGRWGMPPPKNLPFVSASSFSSCCPALS